MKFLVDAQLPAHLARLLVSAGHDAMHTREMPAGNASSDREITRFADEDGRVIVTKDRDFRDGHLVTGSPKRLLTVTTGNITKRRSAVTRGEPPRRAHLRAR